MTSFLKKLFSSKKEPVKEKPEPIDYKKLIAEGNYDHMIGGKTDYLGYAAREKHQALAAIKTKDFDTAWKQR